MADPITREQVERAIEGARNRTHGPGDSFGTFFSTRLPGYVLDGWREAWKGAAMDPATYIAALTRWRDELAAAEPVRRVARWSEADGLYRLDPPHEYQIGDGDCRAYLVSRVQAIAWGYEIEGSPIRKVARWDATRGAYVALDAHGTVCMITTERAQAIDWGYDPEGGPEPVRDWKSDRAIAAIWPIQPAEDSPERLRERREGIPWTLNEAAAAVSKTPSNLNGGCVPWQAADVSLCEGKPFAGPAYAQCRALYAAALSAEEERRAAVGAWAAGGGVLHYSPPTEPERPAHRFKVGDLDPALHETALAATRMLHCGKWPLSLPRVRELPGFDAWNTGPLTSPDWIAQLEALLAEPAPPAPEVVDVPQPLVKRFGGVEASWGPGEDHVTLVEPARGVGLPAPLALLRAMLAAIDAQQGGAS